VNTPAHIILGAAVFGRRDRPGVTWSALAGGLAPDLTLYAMTAVSIFGLGVPARTVFRDYYHSDAWQAVFAVDNSFVLWGILAAFAVGFGRPRLTAFAAAALLHLAFDFPLHNHDARRHFWPLSDWVFVSPVSYWDAAHHGRIVARVELALTLLLAGWCLVRFPQWAIRAAVAALALAQVSTSSLWRWLF
jgi:hypothetical protein